MMDQIDSVLAILTIAMIIAGAVVMVAMAVEHHRHQRITRGNVSRQDD